MIVNFDGYDLVFIAMHAARRDAVKTAHEVSSKKIDVGSSDLGAHYIGAMGEYAVGRALSIKLDKRVHLGGDNGTDLHLNGKSLQVKTRKYSGHPVKFYFNNVSDFVADIGIGVQVLSATRVHIFGWISREEFCALQTPFDFGYGARVAVDESALHPISTLREATMQVSAC